MPDLLPITDAVADWAIIIAAAASAVFAYSYAFHFEWRQTPAGRALLGFVTSLLSVAVIAFLGRWLGPEYFGREILRPLTWVAVAVSSIRMTYVLWATSAPGEKFDIGDRKHK